MTVNEPVCEVLPLVAVTVTVYVSAEVPVEWVPLLPPPLPQAASPISATKTTTAANAFHCRLRAGAAKANNDPNMIAPTRASQPPPIGVCFGN